MEAASRVLLISIECEKAAWQHGFRRKDGTVEHWLRFTSTTVPGTLFLTATDPDGPWLLALDHAGVIAELGITPAPIPGPGLARYAFETLRLLYDVLLRVYQLSASLPDTPLQDFCAKVKDLPVTTEAERLVVQRIGQNVFRNGLIAYWKGHCPLTAISDTALLRASHIIPWSQCATDADRLDIYNGFLLSALWDAAFDRGLVTFDDDGTPLFSPALSDAGKAELRWHRPIPLTSQHQQRLSWHRVNVFIKDR